MTNNEYLIKYLTPLINEYLSNGGLFNPEHMNHEELRNLLIEIREYLTQIYFGVEE
jgi:hypothetical protein